ncbi:hypothetical protein Hthe01_20570 [Hydrogenophilus thermoluteolus]|uniref:thermonuclease family protein n=1 Tax=Hydrogenophilus thermoluteolus TaxID=297 RepID=UPI0024A04978|nr:thermonuclease family protein [Hydrogenophilus thermoluteolus]GLW61708.1 hypothetical protein Hthe01_20570 [Hydrogenophilus thermoluteolus]
MRAVFSIICGIAAALLSLAAHAERISGVSDGDTLTCLAEKRQIRVRLAQIDAPEKRQPFGEKAKQALSNLVFGKTVELIPRDVLP